MHCWVNCSVGFDSSLSLVDGATGKLRAGTQMVWPWKLQSSHFDSSSIFQNVLSHSPVSSFFSLIHNATCIMRRGISQSLHNDSTVSSSSRGREVLLKSGPPC